MRFMITAAPDPDRPKEDAPPPDDNLIAAYMRFNEELHKAGVLITAEGLNPASKNTRVVNKGGKRVVVDGPFIESKELVGGFYLIDVASHEEAVAWALRCPTGIGHDDVLTVLQMTGAEDVPPEMLKIVAEVAPTWSKTWVKPKKPE